MGNLDFIDKIEGRFDTSKTCKLLFILREHGGSEDAAESFYFKNQFMEKNGGDARRYFNVLGRLALRILEPEENISKLNNEKYNQKLKEVLECCAFINLAPFWGGKNCGDNKDNERRFSGKGCVFDEFKNIKLDDINDKAKIVLKNDSTAKDIAKQRLHLINQVINSDEIEYILTVSDIYDALCDKYNDKTDLPVTEFNVTNKTATVKFKSCKINGTKIYSFYHPSYSHIKYDNLNSLKFLGINNM